MKTGCDLLIACRPRQHVAGKLLDRKLVERHVGSDRVDDPIAVGPNGSLAIFFVAVRVAVPGEVQPRPREPFGVVCAGQQSIDDLPIRLRAFVGQKLLDFCGRRRDAG